MASADFVVRCRTANGQFFISDLNGNTDIKAMTDSIQNATGIKADKMKILFAYPPKFSIQNKTAKLLDVVIIDDAPDVPVMPEMSKPPLDADQEECRKNSLACPKIVNQIYFFKSGNMRFYYNGIMMRYDVPSNNSSLFTSIFSILNRGEINLTKSNRLRKLVAEAIRRDPVKYNSASLGCDIKEYSYWIFNPNFRGGAIELDIFSARFNLEICVINIIGLCTHRFGGRNGYKDRGILIFDGIHYVPLVMHLESDQQTIFPATHSRPLDIRATFVW